VAYSAGGDGDGNPLELILDSELPDPPTNRAKESPGHVPGLQSPEFAVAAPPHLGVI